MNPKRKGQTPKRVGLCLRWGVGGWGQNLGVFGARGAGLEQRAAK